MIRFLSYYQMQYYFCYFWSWISKVNYKTTIWNQDILNKEYSSIL